MKLLENLFLGITLLLAHLLIPLALTGQQGSQSPEEECPSGSDDDFMIVCVPSPHPDSCYDASTATISIEVKSVLANLDQVPLPNDVVIELTIDSDPSSGAPITLYSPPLVYDCSSDFDCPECRDPITACRASHTFGVPTSLIDSTFCGDGIVDLVTQARLYFQEPLPGGGHWLTAFESENTDCDGWLPPCIEVVNEGVAYGPAVCFDCSGGGDFDLSRSTSFRENAVQLNEHIIYVSEQALTISPNPASNRMTVSYDDLQNVSLTAIYGIDGRSCNIAYISNTKGEKVIDVSELPPGIYILEAETAMKREFIKFIKH